MAARAARAANVAAARAPRSARAAAAAAAAARAARSARVAAARAGRLGSGFIAALNRFPIRGEASTKSHDAKSPTDKDVESDEAAFEKGRDRAEMTRRFKIFKHYAIYVHHWNNHLPPDPEEAAIYIQKRREARLLLSKDEDVSCFDECYLPMELGPFADGGDPEIEKHCMSLL
ncbi:hypothetical protein HU200_032399 [Digitaria exilis]|uniref:Uncharacterized protein n=1 Tax=Digitaria exilis TaxID=1010633 RepID=A0A835BP93_9POAL|nr:hypothetical protein HU200_032399 [Digitaria exilis]